MKKIGNVGLDYKYYKGTDLYSDGDIEDELLEACKNDRQEELLRYSNKWPVLYHLSEIREYLLEWYPFTKEDDILEIGAGCGGITGVLSRKAKKVTCIELSERRSLINAYRHKECSNIEIIIGNFQAIEPNLGMYDYITLIGVWEYAGLYIKAENPYLKMLDIVKKHLNPDGKIIIAIENKMGLKYWNGAVEDHTGKMYSGLNDYTDDRSRKVRTFSKMEIEEMFRRTEIKEYAFYYPMPDYKLPDIIYSDRSLPHSGRERNFGKDYSAAHIYNFNDAIMSDQLARDGMFSYFANSFLIIAGEDISETDLAKYSRGRNPKFKIKTEIYNENGKKFIRKIALNESSIQHILQMKKNEERWKGCLPKLNYAEGWVENGKYMAPYIEGEDLDTFFYEFRHDPERFVEKFVYYISEYFVPDVEKLIPFEMTDSFVSIFGSDAPKNSKSLKYTNIDMIFSNIKVTENNQLYCFDYEWIFGFPIPYEYVIWRIVYRLYLEYGAYLKAVFSKEQFLEKVGIKKENLDIYERMEQNFIKGIYGKENYLWNYKKTSITQSTQFYL